MLASILHVQNLSSSRRRTPEEINTGIKLAELAGEAADQARDSARADYQERRNDWGSRPGGGGSDFLTGMILGES